MLEYGEFDQVNERDLGIHGCGLATRWLNSRVQVGLTKRATELTGRAG
jgi:hypothetical protein